MMRPDLHPVVVAAAPQDLEGQGHCDVADLTE